MLLIHAAQPLRWCRWCKNNIDRCEEILRSSGRRVIDEHERSNAAMEGIALPRRPWMMIPPHLANSLGPIDVDLIVQDSLPDRYAGRHSLTPHQGLCWGARVEHGDDLPELCGSAPALPVASTCMLGGGNISGPAGPFHKSVDSHPATLFSRASCARRSLVSRGQITVCFLLC